MLTKVTSPEIKQIHLITKQEREARAPAGEQSLATLGVAAATGPREAQARTRAAVLLAGAAARNRFDVGDRGEGPWENRA